MKTFVFNKNLQYQTERNKDGKLICHKRETKKISEFLRVPTERNRTNNRPIIRSIVGSIRGMFETVLHFTPPFHGI